MLKFPILGGVGPVVLQDFADWEKQHRGSWIQVTDYDSAAKCFRMTPAWIGQLQFQVAAAQRDRGH